jgi:glucose-6-phosphate 1-dehydrogenase
MADDNSAAPPSDALVLFGVTGDLARKKIFPVLYAMAKRGVLNVPVPIHFQAEPNGSAQARQRRHKEIRQD